MNQIEIEYEGALDNQVADETIITEDIAELSTILLKEFPKLNVSALTKEECVIPLENS